MTDDLDLDDLERRVLAGRKLIEQDGYRRPDDANAAIKIGQALALIERCRTAEKDAELRRAAAASLTQQVLDLKAHAEKAERDKARAQLARWPEAVAKVREERCDNADIRWACEKITRLATERRE